MKGQLNRTGKILFVLFFAATLFLAYTWDDNAESGVVGSKHDFSVAGGSMFAFDSFQVCVFCHTPHGANIDIQNVDNAGAILDGFSLWNRNSPGQTFNVYQSDTLEYSTTSTSPQPGSRSLLCLSCHDGVGAMNVLISKGTLTADLTGSTINQFGDAASDPIIGKLNIGDAAGTGAGLSTDWGTGGDDLGNDHPIGFSYNTAIALSDGRLTVPDSSESVDAGKIVRLFDGRLECSSCHNPHDNSVGAFLVMSNADSALCLTCHDK